MIKKLLLIVAVILVQKASAQITLTEKNIDAVLKQMTLQEKADLLIGCIEGTNYFGVPQPTGSDPSNVILIPGAAGQANKISRLGIPATVVADGPAGLRISPTRPNDDKTYFCTGYPVPILMASTWNTPLVERVGRTVGKELKEYGVDVLLAPGTNIMRNPLCGRNFEYYSEDPFLSGYICAAMVNGIQREGVGACVKHFAKTELLQPGQSQKLTMDFSNYDLATFYHEDSAWKTIAGTYIVEICEDAETIKISMPLRIKDTTKYAVNNVLNN